MGPARVCSTALIELMGREISLSNKTMLSQSELSEMHCISYGACKHETCADFCFQAKQIQSQLEFHHLVWRKKVLLWILNAAN